MEKISLRQLSASVVLFQIGSSPLFLLASQAGHDAWISVLIAMASGLLLLVCVTLPIYRLEPDKTLVEILLKYFGTAFGSLVAFAYVVYFIYKAVRNVREFGDLMIMYLLPNTPLSVIMIVLLLAASYTVYHGIEVFARIAEILLWGVTSLYLLLFGLIVGTGLLDFERLLPVMEKGLKSAVDAALPEVVSFPFGEMVLFLMFWKTAAARSGTPRWTIISYIGAGLFITATNVLIITGLGHIAEVSVIPLLQLTNLIKLTAIFQRMDPIVGLLLFFGVFMKMTAYFLAGTLAASQLFKIRRRLTIVPVAAAIFIGASLFRSYMQQVRVGFELNIKYHFPIFQIVLPIVILLWMLVRSRLHGSKARESS